MIKLKFLGTGGVPQWNCNCKTCLNSNSKNKRFRSSLFVEVDDVHILIDFGQDCRQQLLQNKIKKIDYAFLTHAHGDHKNGMEQLNLQKNIKIHIPEKVMQELNTKGNSLQGLINRNPTAQIENFKPLSIADFDIDVVELEHKKKYAESSLSSYGYLFISEEFKFAYLTDYNRIIDEEKVKNLDLIISDSCTWEDEGIGHVGVKGAIKIYNKLKPKKMILTHINHTIEHDEVQEYAKQFGNIEIAYDGMEIYK
ncbi:MAG: MBL fold metallo-hydrolase [Alphaproteobacteria bacterium]